MSYFDKSAYLNRLALDTLSSEVSLKPDFPLLNRLQRQHVFTIPFENLDIMLDRGISVELPDIYQKVINNQRGGYCFELNSLFRFALENFGFEARPLLARVHLGREPGGRTHQVTLVQLADKQYITDVGFGALSLRAPILFQPNKVSQQDHLQYRIVEDKTWRYMMQVRNSELGGADWFNMYSFDLEHVCHGDLVTGNHYTSTSPASHFTQMRITSLLTPDGRYAISENQLTSVSGGGKYETEQTTIEPFEYVDLLKTKFKLEIDAKYEDFKTA